MMAAPTDLAAGPALDAAVATQIMGLVDGRDFGEWPEHEWIEPVNEICRRCGFESWSRAPGPCHVAPPPYSTRIEVAWTVLERIRNTPMNWSVQVGFSAESQRYTCTIHDDILRSIEWDAPTPAEAICRAAIAWSESEIR